MTLPASVDASTTPGAVVGCAAALIVMHAIQSDRATARINMDATW
jgi:hypothetical protein